MHLSLPHQKNLIQKVIQHQKISNNFNKLNEKDR